jgi:hypothetical protein
MWSEELQDLSRIYLEVDGVNVKSVDGDFGKLRVDNAKHSYVVSLLKKGKGSIPLSFDSVSEMIIAGWAVD